MVHKKAASSAVIESEIKPARLQHGKLLSEIVELERRYPELVEVRHVQLDDLTIEVTRITGRTQRLSADKIRRAKKRHRAIAAARMAAPGKTAAMAGSHIPVHPPHIVASDPVNDLSTRLAAELRRNTSVDLSDVSVPKLVQSLLRVIPRKTESNELADRIGPFYDTTALRNWLGISRQALEKRIAAGKLLACVTSDRVRLYPTWQFTDSGSLLPGLSEALTALKHGTDDGWVIAAWLTTPVDDLDGTAAEWLAGHRDPGPVIELARHDAAAWAA